MPGCINNTGGSSSRPPRVLPILQEEEDPSLLQGTKAISTRTELLSAPHHHHGLPTYRSRSRSLSTGFSLSLRRRSGGGLRPGLLSIVSAGGCYYRTMLSLLVLGFYLTERREGMTTAAAHPGGGAGTYRTDYVDESCICSSQSSCGDSFTLSPITNGAGHVALSRNLNLHTQFSCKFTIVAPLHQTVQVVINNISIPETRDCKAGILRVYDGIPGNGGWELTRACGDTAADRVVRSKTNQVTLYYYQGADILWDPKAFNITYTYVHEHRPDSNQLCNETSEYLCANKLCISRTLKCDGYDNCGDRSEELMDVHVCGSRYNKSDPVVAVAIGSVVGVVLAISLLIAFAYWARRRAGPLFTDAHLHRNEDNGEGDDQVEQPDDTRPPATAAYLSVPDLTRDLIDRPRTNPNNEPSAAQSDLSPLDVFADQRDGPPPSYSSLFPDLV